MADYEIPNFHPGDKVSQYLTTSFEEKIQSIYMIDFRHLPCYAEVYLNCPVHKQCDPHIWTLTACQWEHHSHLVIIV
jgi:hypothetical protein